jgi:hypothetical protein
MKQNDTITVAFDTKDFEILDSERELLAIRGGKGSWVGVLLELLSKSEIHINGSCTHNNCNNNSNNNN